MLLKLARSASWLSAAAPAYSRSFSERSPAVVVPAGSAAAITARWTEAYSSAEEKADSARVRWIIQVVGRLGHVLGEARRLVMGR
ncbi:hypothetical protein SFUMM280S_09572 [Streptomyces fumanus]